MRRAYAEIHQTEDGDYALKSSYDPGLVAALKLEIPATDRAWNRDDKLWVVTEAYLDPLVAVIETHLGLLPHIQTSLPTSKRQTETRLVQVEYLGAAKDRGGDEPMAYGYADDNWSVMFPLSVLKEWFQVSKSPQVLGDSTYYAVLGLKKQADTKEIKAAFRRMARQWHPDVCREPDANAMFQQINHAHHILSDEKTRRKYDAGLILLSTGYKSPRSTSYADGWRPPLRCGWLLVEGIAKLGKFQVSTILQWEDCLNAAGQVMVSSWAAGANKFQVVWV